MSLFRHLDFFEMVRNEDDSELAKRFDLVSFLLLNISLSLFLQVMIKQTFDIDSLLFP